MRPRVLPARAAALASSALALLLAGCAEEELERPEPLYGEATVRYPPALWDAGVEGETTLRVRVTDAGAIDSIEVAESSGHPGLDSAAIAGTWELRFEPGLRNGRAIPMWATLPVIFVRDPEAADPRTAAPPGGSR